MVILAQKVHTEMTNSGTAMQPQTHNQNFSSLEELYQLYGRPAFGLAMRVLNDSAVAEEAVQEVFLRYWQQPGLYTIQSVPFINWLLREVHSNCLDRLKSSFDIAQRSRFSRRTNATTAILKIDEPASQETARINMMQEQARQTVASLSQEHRNLLEMAFFKGLSHQEIAQATGQSIQTIRQTLTRGLLKLKEELAQ
jgi:RNA polymerase sigma-70 factor (ECF subfamily)